MKAVIISILLLAMAILGSVINVFFVNSRIAEMSELVTDISQNSEGREKKLEKLTLEWSENQSIFRLSTSLREVDRVSEGLLTLQIACQSQNEWAIRQSCVLLCDAFDDIARYETFNIFKII